MMDLFEPYAALESRLLQFVATDDQNAFRLLLRVVTARHTGGISALVSADSGSGKSYMARLAGHTVPEEQVIQMQAASPQASVRMALNEPDGLNLDGHLILRDEREPGIRDDPQYRTFLEDGELTRQVVSGGRTVALKLRGRPSQIQTTVASEIDEEDESRRLIISLASSPNRTREILKLQAQLTDPDARSTLDAVLAEFRAFQARLPSVPIRLAFSDSILDAMSTTQSSALTPRLFRHVQTLVRANALRNHDYRDRDGTGAIVAVPNDYVTVRDLMAPYLIRFSTDIPDAVSRLAHRCVDGHERRSDGHLVRSVFTRPDILRWTGLTRRTAERHVAKAIELGLLLVIERGTNGVLHKYRLPHDVEARLEGGCPLPEVPEFAAGVAVAVS